MRNYILKALLISCLFFLSISCEKAMELEPTPNSAITGITIIQPDGTKREYPAKADADGNIDITIEGSIKMDLSKLRMFINIPNNSKVISDTPLGQIMDFSKPVSFEVVASDGSFSKYTVNVQVFATTITVNELWYKLGSEFAFSQHNNRSLAISGDYIVVHDRSLKGAYNYYDMQTGKYAGALSNEGIDIDALHMISDDAGNIVTCSFTPAAGGVLRMYWWNGLKAAPKKLVEWTSTVKGNLGRKIFVRGNMTKLAYVYLTEADGNKFVRWEVKNGEVTSIEPDIIEIAHPVSTGWGTNGRIIPVELGKESHYFVNSSRKVRITYMDGISNSQIYNSEDDIPSIFNQWLGGGQAFDYVNMNEAKFLFVMEQNGVNWMPSIYTVHNMMKSPSSIANITNLIHTRKYRVWENYPLDPTLGQNGNVLGEVRARVAPGGRSANVVFLCTNGGIAVWEIKLD